MKKLFLILLVSSVSFQPTFAQNCEIHANAFPNGTSDVYPSIYCGQSVTLNAEGYGGGTVILSEDFNTSSFGPGWSSTPGSVDFSNPCSPGGVDGTPHAWMGSSTSVPRTIVSQAYDLSIATAGVTICFDLLYATQGDAAPCEGPDEPGEGVYLQYSTDGGTTWQTIHYFDPNGGNDPQLTNWNNYCFQIPAAAITTSTMFRWHQTNDSGADYDHWGIDNVQIVQNDVNAEIVWGNVGDSYYYSYGVGSPGGDHPSTFSPTSTTTYTVTITTGTGDVCTDQVTVTVVDPVYEVNLTTNPDPATVCQGECVDVSGDAYQVLDPGGIITYENNELAPVISTNTSIDINVQGLNTSSIYAGLIQSLTINHFQFSGTFVCTNFGGCNCNGSSIGFGNTCSISTSGFTVTLTSPGGCTIILAPQNSATGDYNNTVFVPVGGTAIGGSFPTGGPWDPNEPFANLNGCGDPNGVWTLTFSSPGFGLGTGYLTGWGITFDNPPIHEPVDFSWSPTSGVSNTNDINTQICPTALGVNNYTLTVSNGTPGCATHQEPVTITVSNCTSCTPPSVSVAPLTTCAPSTVDLSDAISPLSGANFSYYNNVADAVNSTNSIASTVVTSGSYWVRVEDLTDPTCFDTLEIIVTITPVQDASFTLTDFCEGTTNAASNIATSGGTFSILSPMDGATINPTTGEITNGVAGTTYTVQYSLGGTCPASNTATVSVLSLTFTNTITDENCGNGDGEIVLTPTSGSGSYTFSIDGGTTTQSGGTFSGLSAGNYSVVITDNTTGCSANGNISVSTIGGVSIDNVNATDPTCNGACDGSITLTVSGGTSPYTFEWEDASGNPIGGNTPSISGLCSGNYSVSVYDNVTGVACAVNSNVTLTDPVIVDSSFTLTDFCSGTTNAASNIATPGGTFSILSPLDGASIDPTTGEITNGVAGTTYTVQYSLGGACPTSSTATVTVSSIGFTSNVTGENCGNSDGEIALSTTSGAGPFTFSIDGGVTTQSDSIFSGLTTGTYAVFIEDATGCTSTTSVIVPLTSGPIIDSIVTTDPTCVGTCDGTATVYVSGGTAPYTFEWEDASGTTIGNTATINNLCAQNYTVNITESTSSGGTTVIYTEDFNSGAGTWALNVPVGTEGADPNFFTVNDNEGGIAPGGCGVASNGDPTLHITSVFNSAGGAAYDAGGLCGVLFCPETHRRAESPIINTVGATGLTLNFDYIANGSPPNDQATVWYNDGSGWTQLGGALSSGVCGSGQGLWTAYSSPLPASCENISNLQVAIRWDNNDDGAGTDPSVAINNLNITKTNSSASACPATATATLTAPASVDSSFTLTDFCAGTTNAASNIATPGGTFSILSPIDGATINSTTGEITNGVAGTTYTVQYSLGGTCPASSTATVTVLDVAFTSVVTDENCGNGDGSIVLTVTSGTGPYTFSIDGGATTQTNGTFNGLSANSYNVIVTDNTTACTHDTTVVVSIAGGVSIDNVNATDPTCNGACDGSITLIVSGGTSPYTFDWEDASGNPIGGSTSSINGLCAGNYSVSVYDNVTGVACAVNSNVTLTDPVAVDSNFTLTDFCEGTTNAASNIASPGGTFSILSPLDGATINPTTGEITNGVAGTTYTVQYVVNCSSKSTEQVQVYANPTPTITGDLIYCSGTTTQLDAGAGYSNYSWSNGENTQIIDVSTINGLSVTVIDANGCQRTSDPVNVLGSTPVTTTLDTTICEGDIIEVHGNLVDTAGVYTQTFVAATGCDSVSTVTVHLVPTPTVGFVGNNLKGCAPLSTIFTSTSSGNLSNCQWAISNGVTLTGCGAISTIFENTGCYDVTLTVTTPEGCANTMTKTNYVCVVPTPVANFTYTPQPLTTLEWTASMQNLSTGGDAYTWYFDDGTETSAEFEPTHQFPNEEAGDYEVMLIAYNEEGCADTTIQVIHLEEELIFYVPNTFTPDKNSFNETFQPVFTSGYDPYNYTLYIFDRWGEMLFESHNASKGWDGTYGGKTVQDGVYIWKIIFKRKENDKRENYTGNVNVLR